MRVVGGRALALSHCCSGIGLSFAELVAPAQLAGPWPSLEDDLDIQDIVLGELSRRGFDELLLSTTSPAAWDQRRQELDELADAALAQPPLALAAAQALYVFGWFDPARSVADVAVRAAQLFLLSLVASGCDVERQLERFLERGCETRWFHAVMLLDYAGAKGEAAALLQKMRALPRYAQVQWMEPQDMNLNELFFPGTARPLWEGLPVRVPFATFLEEIAPQVSAELGSVLAVDGLLQRLHAANDAFEHHSLRDEWLHIGLVRYLRWYSQACGVFQRTCALLASRAEVSQCNNVNALLIRLLPGRGLKPHFGNAPRLSAHLGLSTAHGARMRVGPAEVTWEAGRAVVFDDTFRHSVTHVGSEPRYVLNVCFCHPCDLRHPQPQGFAPPCGSGGVSHSSNGTELQGQLLT